jgi:hypothetical protein
MNLGNTCGAAWLLPTVIVQSREGGVKKYPFHFARLVLLFVSAVVLFAQTDHTTAFTGTWKLNGAKSTFNPGPAPKSVTVTNAQSRRNRSMPKVNLSSGHTLGLGAQKFQLTGSRTQPSSRRCEAIHWTKR